MVRKVKVSGSCMRRSNGGLQRVTLIWRSLHWRECTAACIPCRSERKPCTSQSQVADKHSVTLYNSQHCCLLIKGHQAGGTVQGQRRVHAVRSAEVQRHRRRRAPDEGGVLHRLRWVDGFVPDVETRIRRLNLSSTQSISLMSFIMCTCVECLNSISP